MTDEDLKGTRVAILVDNGFEQVELTEPKKALDQAGAKTGITKVGLKVVIVAVVLAIRAREKELRAIIVETQLENKNAMDFYLKKGFRMCGYNDRYYTNIPKSSHDIAIFFSLDLQEAAL